MPEYKVLIVDYDPKSIQQMRRVLEDQGHEIRVAQDGVAGLDLFAEFHPHLTLVEAMLPKKHGFDVCGEMKQTTHGEHHKVAIITGVYKGRRYRTQALHQHHADAYFEKPIDDATLSEQVKILLDGLAADPAASAPKPDAVVPTSLASTDPAPLAESTPGTAADAAPNGGNATSEAEADISDRLDDLFG